MDFFRPFWESPRKGSPDSDTIDNDTLDSDGPDDDIPDNDIPDNDIPDNDTPDNDGPDINTPDNDGPDNDPFDNDTPDNDGYGSDSSAGTVVGPNKPQRPSKTILDMLKKATQNGSKKVALDRSIELIEGVGLQYIQPSCKNASPASQDAKSDASTEDMKAVVEHVHEIRGQESVTGQPFKYRTRRSDTSPLLDRSDECVLALRRVFSEDYKTLIDTFLDVQSPLILRALMEAMPEEKARLESKPSFKWPYDRLFRYRWRIHDAAVNEGELCVKHVAVLLDLILEEYQSRLRDINAMLPKGTASFDILADAFSPGDVVVDRVSEGARAYRVTSSYYKSSLPREVPDGSDIFVIEYEYVDHDGQTFGTVSRHADIARFEGIRYLTELALFPFESHPNIEGLRRNLMRRGLQFEELKGHHFKAYWDPRSETPTRVVVNTLAIRGLEPRMRIKVNDMSVRLDSGQLKADDLIICTDKVPYFSLDEKAFLWGDPEYFEEIQFDGELWHELILSENIKRVLRSMTANHLKGYKLNDVIAGKGKGRVVLLHGPPGVGKTLTVEAIAEHIERPLYTITPGELGVSSVDIERNLRRALDISTALRAILLLDEADIYMEQRVSGNIAHNATIAAFLRLLEYHQGVMYLTTSRPHVIDTSFHSRLHYCVNLPTPSGNERKEIWANFARRTGGIKLPPKELDEIALQNLSGRQIRNTLSMCTGLVAEEGNVGPKTIGAILNTMGYNQG
ncbi:P-loop containing nucleoside triphosphate hydrolase protein [Aspergillus campestris IBT 28561]|uniref:P-loop containing nucleoside triphosphate hydrolase protein n=1 Tax=Aspergillus campestris (strain IBT 28561) TaxID=1392248 RepID=A0A2I1CZL5_ASPC2|nr:P-loop containing nucleoside triphosphate hydrolase protein [Aspergillus campestris IBT 28561]PKY03059.1 P-loop containing nucleoside triphosphate hydrolase protein [Aspergillus campestris IBT 28561]